MKKNMNIDSEKLDSESEENFRNFLTNLFSFVYIHKSDI